MSTEAATATATISIEELDEIMKEFNKRVEMIIKMIEESRLS